MMVQYLDGDISRCQLRNITVALLSCDLCTGIHSVMRYLVYVIEQDHEGGRNYRTRIVPSRDTLASAFA